MMDCLLELFFEIFLEGVLELIGYCYIKLMCLIVPNKTISPRTKKIMKNIVTIVAGILIIVLIIGLFFLTQDDPSEKNIGKCLTYIPLSIMALQIVLGVTMKIISHIKR